MTRQRQAVLDILSQSDSQTDAGWVYEQVRKDMPNISLSTVHRTLSLLREAGLVEARLPPVSIKHRDGQTSVECHATCIRCGNSTDVNIDVPDDLEQKMAAATSYLITGHRLEFYGLCPACARLQATN